MIEDDNTSEETSATGLAEREPAQEKPEIQVPEFILVNDFHKKSVSELHQIAQELDLRVSGVKSKFNMVYEILSLYSRKGTRLEAEGILEANGDGFGFLRWPSFSFSPTADSIYVSPGMIRNHQLRGGQRLRGEVRAPRHKERYLTLETIIEVEGTPLEDWREPPSFDRLTALFPTERILLENKTLESVSARVVDLVAPLGKGQRGLIVASPRSGKTILLKEIAKAISLNHPEIELIILLIDERPEEVTDFRETVQASVYSSTFDESPARHIQVAELVLERAKRLVEMKKDVVILLDSITRLSRGYNNLTGGKGGLTQGGLNPKALQKARRFFSVARNVEEGGSLTILATALVGTESRMDEIIFEEFKGTGNLEIHLDRELMERRIFPAIHTLQSGTRRDELLYHKEEYARLGYLRKQMAQLPAGEAMEKLVQNIKRTKSNVELLLSGLK